MDYIITSSQLDDPAIAQTHFTEQVESIEPLPFSYDFDSYFAVSPEAITRASLGLPEKCRIATCGNSVLVKFRQKMFEAVLQIMRNVDDLVFVLMPGGELYHQENLFWHRTLAMIEESGIALERFVIVPNASRSRQFGLVALADIYLDFFPFSGANSLLDPLYLGTPPVVLNADYQLRCRQAAAILSTIACDDLVANSVSEFITIGTRLLTDTPFMQAMMDKLGPDNLRKSQIFSPDETQRAFSTALQRIHASSDDEAHHTEMLARR